MNLVYVLLLLIYMGSTPEACDTAIHIYKLFEIKRICRK